MELRAKHTFVRVAKTDEERQFELEDMLTGNPRLITMAELEEIGRAARQDMSPDERARIDSKWEQYLNHGESEAGERLEGLMARTAGNPIQYATNKMSPGPRVPYIMNPTSAQAERFFTLSGGDLRALKVRKGDIYIWPARAATHFEMQVTFGLDHADQYNFMNLGAVKKFPWQTPVKTQQTFPGMAGRQAAAQIETLSLYNGRTVKVFRNPTYAMTKGLLSRGNVRTLYFEGPKDLYIWPAYEAEHDAVHQAIDFDDTNAYTGYLRNERDILHQLGGFHGILPGRPR